MIKGNRALAAALAASFLMSGCSTDDVRVDDGFETPGFDDDFAFAARTYAVPADLLKAIAYVETSWQMVDGEAEHEGQHAGAGLFGLSGENLVQGAAAAGIDENDARYTVTGNIAAAAAQLARLAAEQGVTGDDLMTWTPVIAAFAQIPDEEGRAAYVDEVIAVLATGATSTGEDGTLIASISEHAELEVPRARTGERAATDFAGAILRSSPNFNSRGGHGVSLVVVHSCEGSYAGCWGYLRTAAASASAHYVIKENGAEVTQLVRESNRAWHVAADYECSRAGNSQCNKNGVGTNSFSVGIEHAGYASQSTWSTGIIETSAKLTCDITRDHGVPRDRNHVVSHGQLQPWNRTDPGPNWPWSHYMDRVRAHCGEGGGGTGAIIVDSNNANNNQAVAKIELTGTWGSSSSTPGYYGTGYWYANTSQTSAPATFWFHVPAAGTKTVEAWWTSGTNRSTAAPFIGFNAAGTEVGRRTVNQQGSGSQWVTLGTWNFTAGWNKVVLSRWAAEGKVVLADAVRIR